MQYTETMLDGGSDVIFILNNMEYFIVTKSKDPLCSFELIDEANRHWGPYFGKRNLEGDGRSISKHITKHWGMMFL